METETGKVQDCLEVAVWQEKSRNDLYKDLSAGKLETL